MMGARVGASVQESNTFPSCFGVNRVAGQSCVLNRNEGWRLLWPFPGTLVPVESSFLFLFFFLFLRHTRLSLLSARLAAAVVVVVGKSEQRN